jgi:allantoin racemase
MIHQDRYIQPLQERKACAIRLLLITPVDPVAGKEGPFPIRSWTTTFLLPETSVDEVLCKGAPAPISESGDFEQVIPMVMSKGRWAQSEGYDAVVINCMVDPGLEELQLDLQIPVIGAGRAAESLGSTVGRRTARIYPNRVYINDFANSKEQVLQELSGVAQRQIETRGVDSFVFDCAYLGGLSSELQDRIGVPVMATTEIALRTAETIVLLGIKPIRPDVKAARVSEFRQSIFRTKDNLLHLKGVIQQKAGKTLAKFTGAGSVRR